MTAPLRARADVATDAPARYAKQLVSHLGRRVEWTTDGAVSTAEIAGGTGVVEVGDGVLHLRAQAPDEHAVTRASRLTSTAAVRAGWRMVLLVVTGRVCPTDGPSPGDARRSRTGPPASVPP